MVQKIQKFNLTFLSLLMQEHSKDAQYTSESWAVKCRKAHAERRDILT